jgi:hypothetical protein
MVARQVEADDPPDPHLCQMAPRARLRHTQDIGVSQTAPMSHLTHEQQVFVLHQIRKA